MERYVLTEQIGLDMVELTNFRIISINAEKILRKWNEKEPSVDLGNYHNSNDDIKGQLIMDSGATCSRIEVRDNKRFNTFIVSVVKKGQGQFVQYDRLKICVEGHADLGNIQNCTVKELKIRLRDILDYIKDEYGIELDGADAAYNYMEINKTFVLDHVFSAYRRTFSILLTNLNASYKTYYELYGQDEEKNSVVLHTQHNKSCQIKVYDKANSIEQKEFVRILSDIARIELVFQQRKIKSEFKTKRLDSITDAMLVECYRKQVRSIYKKVAKWEKRYMDKLSEIIDQHISDKFWIRDVLSILENRENETRTVQLLSVQDIIDICMKYPRKRKQRTAIESTIKKKISSECYNYFNDDIREKLQYIKSKCIYEENCKSIIEYKYYESIRK